MVMVMVTEMDIVMVEEKISKKLLDLGAHLLSGIRSYERDCGYNLEGDFGLIAVTKERR
jgi:hypothetical protein